MLPEPILQTFYGCGVSSALFFVFWLVALRYKNAALADVAWSLGFLLLTIFYAAINKSFQAPHLVLLLMVALWSLRLGIYLLVRTIEHLDQEDSRYKKLREESKLPESVYMLWIFFCQAILQALVTLPFVLVFIESNPTMQLNHYLALAVFVPALVLQSLADHQLASFKASADREVSESRVCKRGLWSYSRHPNYFFEWLIWISFALFALSSPSGYWALLSPLIMLHMLLNVSGVKISEEVSLQSRGEAYKQYQKETPAFFPWFPRRS